MKASVAMLAVLFSFPACATDPVAEPTPVAPAAASAPAPQQLPARLTVDSQLLLQAIKIIGQLPSAQVGPLYQMLAKDVETNNDLGTKQK